MSCSLFGLLEKFVWIVRVGGGYSSSVLCVVMVPCCKQ
jgi:hypothetical protein